MKKTDNFSSCLRVLEGANYSLADKDEIYRTGVIGQFNLTFELAWKALQTVLRLHGVQAADTGSPREILQLGYKFGFLNDPEIWLKMLRKRNTAAHIYSESDADELLQLIRTEFTAAFKDLEQTLREKESEITKCL